MTNVTEIKQAPNQEVIDRLEKVFALAKSGDLQSVAVAGVRRNGFSVMAWSAGDRSVIELLGAISSLHHDFAMDGLGDPEPMEQS